ncbi:YcaO-like family protein [Streptomyces sp. WAC01490]|uniref:YcaO-like family protein n=1 Tax=unclassified Streptomyces TaxID=2593676 RepID=UPI003F389D71
MPDLNDVNMKQLDPLLSRYGVVGDAFDLSPSRYRGLPELSSYGVDLGSGFPGFEARPDDRVVAGGHALGDKDRARLLAIAEGCERYSGAQFGTEGVVTAAAHDLDGRVLDWSRVPRLSDAEYAHPRCPLVPFDPAAPIRWVRGVDLRDGDPTWLPLSMAAYRSGRRLPAERFVASISTGCAVHTDPASAVFGGLSEVVERDMIAVLWLQKLPLPHIPFDVLDERELTVVEWAHDRFLDTVLLDATSDIGVPTVYCMQTAPHDQTIRTMVGCGTGLTIQDAAYKALLEVTCFRDSLHVEWEEPESFADYTDISDGAKYMGKPENAPHFAFLTDDHPDRPSFQDRGRYAADATEGLTRAVRRFAELDMAVVAVDRTTTELASVGLHSATVVIPDLQPMSLVPLAQYHAHPRLYSAPAAMGYRVLPVEELNPCPQPFA